MAEEKKKDELSEDQIIDLIADFYQDPDFEELKRLYLTKSFPEILAVDRLEQIHSAFLAWLLDMKESHGLGDFPIKQFLKILVRRDRKQGLSRHDNNNANNNAGITSTKNIYVEILNEDFTITEMYVTREKPAQTEDRKGRMDILINMKAIFPKKTERNIHIVIENKVYSKEHDNQTQKYFEYIIKEFSTDVCLFVYLTPLPKRDLDNLNKPQCINLKYIQTNYQDLLDYILEPALKKDISMRNRFVIEEYIHSLSLPAIDINSSSKTINLNTIMAMSDNTKKLLNAFWEKNEPLLMAALSSLVETTDDQNIKDKVGAAIPALNQRDKTCYEFNGKSDLGKMDLVTEVVSEILKRISARDCNRLYEDALKKIPIRGRRTKENKFKAIESAFTGNGIEMTCKSGDKFENPFNGELVLSSKEYNDKTNSKKYNTKNYKCVTVDGSDYYILKQWGANNIDNFVYAFYEYFKKETNWGLGDKEIKVIK